MLEITTELYSQIAILTESVSIGVIGNNIFVVHSFDPTMSSNTMSVDFNQLQGICITDFIKLNRIEPADTNAKGFLYKLERYLDNKIIMTVRFSKATEYMLFSR